MPEIIEILAKHNYWTGRPRDLGVRRGRYLARMQPLMSNRLVKVLVGQRRSGKSWISLLSGATGEPTTRSVTC